MTTKVGAASLDFIVDTNPAKAAITAAVGNIRAQLQGLARPVKIDVGVNQGKVDAEIATVRTKLQGLGTDLKNLFRIDASALTTLLAQIGRQITDLRDIENRLRTSGSGAGGSGAGAGGGSPGGVNNAYAAQLRGLISDLRAGATSTAAFEAATRALKTSIDAEIASLRNAGVLTREQQARLDSLRATSGQAGQALRQMGDQAARAAEQAARAAARAAADAARATQRAAQEAARAQSEGVSRLGRELQMAQSQYERGALSLRGYLREMERIRTAGQGMAAGLQAGSREAQNLERIMGGLGRNASRINDQSITKIRADMAAARAEFERATAAAGRFADKRAAIQAYQASMRDLERQIRAVGERTTTTANQMGQLNRLSAQIRTSLNTVNNTPSGAGFSGGILAALRQLPQFAQVAGGSLGAAAAQATALGGSLGGVAAAAGPVGAAIAGVTLAVVGLTAALVASINTAAQFQQTLADIRALTQPTTAQLQQLTQATFDIGKPLGVGAREAAAAVLELNKAGLSATDVIGGGLKGALELAGAAGISAAEGGKLAVSAMTAFGLQSQQLPQIADVFANFSNKTFLGAQDLSQAIAAVGPVARDAGIDIQQFTGLMATLAQGGFKNMSDAGTSLKTMLLSLTAPVDTGAKALHALKVSAFDSAGQMRPLNDVLGDLKGKLVQLTPEAQKQLLRQIFGQDALRAAQILLREGPKAIEANTEAMRKQGEASRVARERLDSLQGAQKKFAAAMEQARIQMGAPFLKPLQAIVEFSTRVVQGFTDIGNGVSAATTPMASLAQAAQQGLAPIADIFRTVVGVIVELWNRVLGPVLKSLWEVWTVIQTAVQTALGIVLQVVSGVFQLVGGIIAGFVGAFIGHGKSVNFTLAGMAAKISEWAGIARAYILAVGKIAATLPVVFKGVGLGVGQIIAGIVKVLSGLASGAKAVFLAAGGYAMAFLRVLGNFASGVGQIIKGVGLILFGFALAAKNAFVDRVQQVLVGASRLFTAFGNGVSRLLQPAQRAFFTYVVQPAQAMGNFVRAAFDRVVGILGGAVSAAGRVLAPLGSVLSALGIGLGEALQNAASAASNAISSFVDRGAADANAAYAAAQRAAEAQAQGTADGVGSIIESGLNAAGQALKGFAQDNGAGSQVDAGLKSVSSGLNTVATAASGLNGELARTTSTLNAGLGDAGSQIRGAGADFQAGVKTVQGSVAQMGTATQQAMAGVKKDLATAAAAAQQTGKAVQAAAAIKPPAVMPSGTKTLADLGLGGGGSGRAATTAAGLAQQAAYKKGLKDLTDQELAAAKAEALRTNNKKAMTAILAEETRREKAHGAAITTTGIALTKYKEALRGKSAAQLKDMLAQAEARKDTAAYNAIKAEQARRTGAATAATRRDTAATERDSAARANLVREIRQSIAAFQLQAQQGKVTAASQLAFNQRMEDFQARVAKLPPALQKGTEALFQQARALSASANGQATATRQTALSGAALIKYKEALRGKSAAQLADLEAEARAKNLGPQLSAILAEKTRRTNTQASADRKAAADATRHAEAASNLERETRQLNERFQTQVDQGKVTTESLQRYRQALEDTRAKVGQLPAALRGNVTALLEQGATLATQGQSIVNRTTEIGKLKDEIQNWTLAELENARARVVASGGDKEKLALLDKEIAKHKQLTDAQAAQALAESNLAQGKADQDTAEGQYENAKAAASGNLARLYQIELQHGQKVQAARDAALRASIANEDRQVKDKYDKLLALEGITAERRKELEAARDRELQANADRLAIGLAKNAQERATAEEDAKRALDEALLDIDRDTRERIRQNALKDLQARTAAVEAEQAAELDAEDLTEAQKYEIRKRYAERLITAKRAEVEQSRQIERDAEIDRYNDAVAEATRQGILDEKRLQADGTYLTVREELQRAHASEMGRIDRQYADEARDYELGVKRDVGKALVASTKETSGKLKEEAEGRVDVALTNLEEMTGAERAAARDVLNTWRATYAAQGKAGEEAVKQIDAALKKLSDTGDKARKKAADLLVLDPKKATDAFGTRLGSIGKADDADSARDNAVQQFAELRKVYEDGIADINAALGQFADKKDEDLTPDEQRTRDGLRATLALYQGFLTQTTTAATAAGQKAADAFTQAQKDQAAESALALAEVNYEVAQMEGKDGGPAYLAGLRAAIAYWKGRLAGMEAGTKEYAEILKKIAELQGKANDVDSDPLVSRLNLIAQAVGKNGKLQKTVTAGLNGLAAYFKAGGAKGGNGSLIAGASALVSGLAEVFKTGDEDIDQVIDTFVSGVQATLGQLAKGDWVGALITGVATVVATIVDIFTGGANSARKAREQIEGATKNVKIFDLSKYAKVVSQGGFWGWLGFKKSEIDQEAVDIAQTLGDALYNSISSGMLNGIKAGKASFADIGLDIRKDLGQVILQGLIDGFMKGAVMQGLLQPFLDKYIEAMKSGNAQALADAANGIQGAIGQANGAIAEFYERVLVPTAKQLDLLGEDSSAVSNRNATQDLGLPASVQVKMREQGSAAQQQVQAAGLLGRAAEQFDQTVRRLQDGGLSADLTLTQPLPEVRTRMRSGALLNG